MKPRDRHAVALGRLVVLAVALASWAVIARACKDLMQ